MTNGGMVLLKLLEYRNNQLHIEAELLLVDASERSAEQLRVLMDEEEISYRFTKRCCKGKFAAVTSNRENESKEEACRAFSFDLLSSEFKRVQKIRFYYGTELLAVESDGYQSGISSMVRESYWCFGEYMIRFLKEADKNTKEAAQKTAWHSLGQESLREGLLIKKAGKTASVVQELKLLANMPIGKNHSRKMFKERIQYWLAYPKWKNKNIWITFDKLYKAGDCGEYFHKYLVKHADKKITPIYIIQKNAPDAKRLQQEGIPIVFYKSKEQKRAYLFAKCVFATHSSVHAFCGFNAWEVQYIQDRLKAVNTCIQHGLSVQDLSADSNRVINNNQRYYCASKYEIENLKQPEYGYEKIRQEEILCLTGIPRYDGLISDRKKQILITPTWRSYLAMPSELGKARAYHPEFKNSEYYQIYTKLISDHRLLESAQKNGYRIVYLLHPVVSAQKKDFEQFTGAVNVVSALEINYEQILRESDLMVTDYSGVQFDFAYMKKPVVYYQPDELPPHYEEGVYHYETQSFGEICTKQEMLVDLLCDYMEHDCQMKKEYVDRVEDFFAYTDHENCRRIYENALELSGIGRI